MSSQSPGPDGRTLPDILARLSPESREEVEYRAVQGDLPFLPEDPRRMDG
jgi:hypothetical protein